MARSPQQARSRSAGAASLAYLESQDLRPEARRGLPSFEATLDQPVEGKFVRAGELMMLDLERNCMKPWTVLLFANGFYAVPKGDRGGAVTSYAWSPFTEVREVQANSLGGQCPFGELPAFTLHFFAQDTGFVFATTGARAEQERKHWISAISGSLQGFARSCFPSFGLATRPLADEPSTRTRILAGYLLRDDGNGVVSLPYCELHAHSDGSALFAMYESERCERLVESKSITDGLPVLDRKGSKDCGCFSLDGLQLCARAAQEKQLWLRAIWNVKVKLMNRAPDPTHEELSHWREAVRERIGKIQAAEAGGMLARRFPATPFGQLRNDRVCPAASRTDAQDSGAPRPGWTPPPWSAQRPSLVRVPEATYEGPAPGAWPARHPAASPCCSPRRPFAIPGGDRCGQTPPRPTSLASMFPAPATADWAALAPIDDAWSPATAWSPAMDFGAAGASAAGPPAEAGAAVAKGHGLSPDRAAAAAPELSPQGPAPEKSPELPSPARPAFAPGEGAGCERLAAAAEVEAPAAEVTPAPRTPPKPVWTEKASAEKPRSRRRSLEAAVSALASAAAAPEVPSSRDAAAISGPDAAAAATAAAAEKVTDAPESRRRPPSSLPLPPSSPSILPEGPPPSSPSLLPEGPPPSSPSILPEGPPPSSPSSLLLPPASPVAAAGQADAEATRKASPGSRSPADGAPAGEASPGARSAADGAPATGEATGKAEEERLAAGAAENSAFSTAATSDEEGEAARAAPEERLAAEADAAEAECCLAAETAEAEAEAAAAAAAVSAAEQRLAAAEAEVVAVATAAEERLAAEAQAAAAARQAEAECLAAEAAAEDERLAAEEVDERLAAEEAELEDLMLTEPQPRVPSWTGPGPAIHTHKWMTSCGARMTSLWTHPAGAGRGGKPLAPCLADPISPSTLCHLSDIRAVGPRKASIFQVREL